MLADEIDGFIDQPIGQVLARFPIGQRSDAIGRKEAGWSAVRGAADVAIKTLVERGERLGHPSLRSGAGCQMPFSEKPIGVAGLAQPLRDRHVAGRQLADQRSRVGALVLGEKTARQVGRQADAGRCQSGQYGGPCG